MKRTADGKEEVEDSFLFPSCRMGGVTSSVGLEAVHFHWVNDECNAVERE